MPWQITAAEMCRCRWWWWGSLWPFLNLLVSFHVTGDMNLPLTMLVMIWNWSLVLHSGWDEIQRPNFAVYSYSIIYKLAHSCWTLASLWHSGCFELVTLLGKNSQTVWSLCTVNRITIVSFIMQHRDTASTWQIYLRALYLYQDLNRATGMSTFHPSFFFAESVKLKACKIMFCSFCSTAE